ncbi:hypothetical protein ACFPIJ_22750 [Dactylosporangium cerinum]|uniref:Uncharacterized protein n=1 Tax=Dactylosporangium cerinum TaxID=1434730 RepID=A0ABV9VXS1_9ACTN
MIDLGEPPWCAIVGFSGLARQALNREACRASCNALDCDLFGPEREWERTAIALEADIWAARHRRNTDITTLRERAGRLVEAGRNDEKAQVYRWRS